MYVYSSVQIHLGPLGECEGHVHRRRVLLVFAYSGLDRGDRERERSRNKGRGREEERERKSWNGRVSMCAQTQAREIQQILINDEPPEAAFIPARLFSGKEIQNL